MPDEVDTEVNILDLLHVTATNINLYLFPVMYQIFVFLIKTVKMVKIFT